MRRPIDDRGRGPRGGPRAAGPRRDQRPGPPARSSKPRGIPPQAIIHEDADVLVVDKPPGMLSARLPDDDRDSLFDYVKLHVRGKQKRPVRDRKSTRLNSSHLKLSRMPSSA